MHASKHAFLCIVRDTCDAHTRLTHTQVLPAVVAVAKALGHIWVGASHPARVNA